MLTVVHRYENSVFTMELTNMTWEGAEEPSEKWKYRFPVITAKNNKDN